MRSLSRIAAAGAGALLVTALAAAPALAHVGISPSEATAGSYTTITFKVPNERDDASTTKLEVAMPEGDPIASVSYKPLPGWSVAVTKAKLDPPVTTDDGQVTEAVDTITWTATPAAAIKPGEFQTFDLSLGPLPDAAGTTLAFKALQTYSDGEVVRWIQLPDAGGAEPENPAPTLTLVAADASPDASPAASTEAVAVTDTTAADDGGNGTAFGIVGIVVGAIGLAVAVVALISARRSA